MIEIIAIAVLTGMFGFICYFYRMLFRAMEELDNELP